MYLFARADKVDECVLSKEAFLFSLVNPYGVQPVKMPGIFVPRGGKKQGNIARNRLLGPAFGKGSAWRYDLLIVAKANESRKSFSHLGAYYECPEGKDGELFLAGTSEFLVADYEVFEFY